MIKIDDMQIPAERYEDVKSAREALKKDEIIVKDNDGNIWIVDNENYPKIEGYGYERIDPNSSTE
ncbi:hypothetical protein EPH95_11305 [Salicibibacter halophilus]|uniref:Uncharacterized protein n=1 Tax=Salicibibacter halophilus TaxID=2502791 RepID=A0A514LJI6_9BACI|nr:hypothetical protein [Salicibibacter halophilus]QDI91685.1 hypothetical protein EPH95_11305 [Salicibibacter halophilus]